MTLPQPPQPSEYGHYGQPTSYGQPVTSTPPAPFYPQQYVYPTGLPAAQPKNGLGIASLVLGIVGLCFTFTFFLGPWIGGPLSVLAIIFGEIGRRRVKRLQATNKSVAMWGLWLGIVAAAIAIVELFLWIALVATAGNAASNCATAINNALNNPTSQSAQQAETDACN